MDDRVKKLKTPADCENFINNVKKKYPELVPQARLRKVELLASEYGATNQAEIEALQAIYAYEEVLFEKHGRKTHASYTWRSVKSHGIIGAVERAVNKKGDPVGFKTLAEMDMQHLAFEVIVIRYPELFSQEAVERSKQRLETWKHI